MRIDPGTYYEWPVKFALHLPLRFEVATTNEQDEIRFESSAFARKTTMSRLISPSSFAS